MRERDIDAAKRAPGAADGVEIAAALAEQLGAVERLLDLLADALVVELVIVHQRQRPERKGFAAAHALRADLDQFEARAAEIADNALRVRRAGADAKRREPRFVFAAQDAQLDAGFVLACAAANARPSLASRTAAVPTAKHIA